MEIREMNDGLKDNTDEKYFPKFSKPIFWFRDDWETYMYFLV
jgi:hypothetical protein